MDPRSNIIEIAKLIYARGLSDASGGLISVKDGSLIYMTPRLLASRYHWQLEHGDILVWDNDKGGPKHPERLPREANLHLLTYKRIPAVNAIIHAHPQYATVFAAAECTLPPIIDSVKHYGTIPLAEHAPLHTPELAENAVRVLEDIQEGLSEHPLAVLQPYHGILVAGLDLNHAYEGLERIEGNARASLLMKLLHKSNPKET